LADADRGGRTGRSSVEVRQARQRVAVEGDDESGYVDNADGLGRSEAVGKPRDDCAAVSGWTAGRVERSCGTDDVAARSFWSDAEWIRCHDGKARRTQPSLRLLVDGMAGRVDLWRIAGNSIVSQLAAEILKAYLETE
jgi:DNA (cytosine-5)-methyltransferase 1